MISYELVKQLRDAGFVTKQIYASVVDNSIIEGTPTLSELIEACGLGFGSLDQCQKPPGVISKYLANGYFQTKPYWIQTEGNTPEESVAKLWLEINKK